VTSEDLTPATGESPVRFGPDGLVPAVIQEAGSAAVLMVGFMDATALAATRATGRVHFWSRSRRRLWRKGETSGHEQLVDEIRVNCERNSLLLVVRQVGAVCHDGYATCYYRRLEPDDSLTVVQERVFDPVTVYHTAPPSPPLDRADAKPSVSEADRDLSAATRLLYGAYACLRDVNLGEQSATSRRLRGDAAALRARLADELIELAGALDGSHRHEGPEHDLPLEAGQVVYWTILVGLRAGVPWDQLRPDRALAGDDSQPKGLTPAGMSKLLRAEASGWRRSSQPPTEPAARCHAVLALVGQAARLAGVDPAALIRDDLALLRAKPYLAPYFAAAVTARTSGTSRATAGASGEREA
jgi:phosphoribosyl-AMP cyclohydrolase